MSEKLSQRRTQAGEGRHAHGVLPGLWWRSQPESLVQRKRSINVHAYHRNYEDFRLGTQDPQSRVTAPAQEALGHGADVLMG